LRTILVVDDEQEILNFVQTALNRVGFSVVQAQSGDIALERFGKLEVSVDLLLTDVVMPELCGRPLAEAAVKLRPGLKILFMSGHTPDVILKEGVKKGQVFMTKPFSPAELAQKVRETLDSKVPLP